MVKRGVEIALQEVIIGGYYHATYDRDCDTRHPEGVVRCVIDPNGLIWTRKSTLSWDAGAKGYMLKP